MEVKLSAELVESTGPWPFTTKRTYRMPDSSRIVWRSRHHRKRLHLWAAGKPEAVGTRLLHALWMPGELNWWIAIVFVLGASLFMLGCLFILAPALAEVFSLGANAINAVFFAGSIPFTTAAYLQLYQAANAGDFVPLGQSDPKPIVLFGWFPHRIGWLSCALQFLGTLLFNVNTFDAMIPGLTWFQQDLEIWIPNVIGSILFLASGYLAFVETSHAHFAWKPASLSWWVTFANLLGCVAFMISAVFAFVPPEPLAFDGLTIGVAFTLLGAVGFLVGSLLMLPETARPVMT